MTDLGKVSATARAPVKVKPLVWKGTPEHIRTEMDAHFYEIVDLGENWKEDRFYLHSWGIRIGAFETLELARAAAQADHERRVLGELE